MGSLRPRHPPDTIGLQGVHTKPPMILLEIGQRIFELERTKYADELIFSKRAYHRCHEAEVVGEDVMIQRAEHGCDDVLGLVH